MVTFLNNNFTEIKLMQETDKEELIKGLATSPNFATTHCIIAKLSAYTEWETEQVKRLCAVAVDNNQVSWIFYDQDVLGFYETILKIMEVKKLEASNVNEITDRIKNK